MQIFTDTGSKQMSVNTLTAIVTSVSSFVLSSVPFLILGWCCCIIYSRCKTKQPALERAIENAPVEGSVTPIYENLLSPPNKSNENEPKLNENAAYSSAVEWHVHSKLSL